LAKVQKFTNIAVYQARPQKLEGVARSGVDVDDLSLGIN
jgi:hypothetical protein